MLSLAISLWCRNRWGTSCAWRLRRTSSFFFFQQPARPAGVSAVLFCCRRGFWLWLCIPITIFCLSLNYVVDQDGFASGSYLMALFGKNDVQCKGTLFAGQFQLFILESGSADKSVCGFPKINFSECDAFCPIAISR